MRGMAAVAASIEETIRPGFSGAPVANRAPPVAKTPVANAPGVSDLEPTIYRFILKQPEAADFAVVAPLASFPFLCVRSTTEAHPHEAIRKS